MNLDTWVFYVLTVLVLMSTPGPSHLLMLSNSAAFGFRNSTATAFGDLSANALQMLAAALGLGVIISSWDAALSLVKWCGVAYLVWIAAGMIRNARPIDVGGEAATRKVSIKSLYLQGFITSASNPKAIFFFSALFPQFISYDGNLWTQFTALSMTYIAIDGFFLALYGIGAHWIVLRLKRESTIWVGRAGGGLMLVAAILLGLKSTAEL